MKKGLTRKQLINQLLNGNMDDIIYIYITDGEDYSVRLTIDYTDDDTISTIEMIKKGE